MGVRNLILNTLNQIKPSSTLSISEKSLSNSNIPRKNSARPLPLSALELENLPYPFSFSKFYDPVHLSENRIIQGFNHLSVVFRERVFFFAELKTLKLFLNYPLIYSKMKLPRKLNKIYNKTPNTENLISNFDKKPEKLVSKKNLAMTPEQIKGNLVSSISEILGTICNKKQKFPFLSSRESALKLLSLELAQKNPLVDGVFKGLLNEKKLEFVKASQLLNRLKELYKIKENWSEIDFEEFVKKVQELSYYQKKTIIFSFYLN